MISNNNNNNNNNDNNNSNNNNKSSSNNKNSNTDSNRLIYNNEKKDDDKDDEYNVQNKDNKKICITITTNKTLITDKTLTGKEREKKILIYYIDIQTMKRLPCLICRVNITFIKIKMVICLMLPVQFFLL